MNASKDFFTAARQGDTATLLILLNAGQSVEAIDDRGVSALAYAAREGHLDILQTLVEHGAEVDSGVSASPQLTPLQQAAWNDHLECARYLIDHGADVNFDYDKRPGYSGRTPLMYALDEMASPNVARLLIKYGADVSIRNSGGTALEIAVSYGAEQIVELLKQTGAKE